MFWHQIGIPVYKQYIDATEIKRFNVQDASLHVNNSIEQKSRPRQIL